MKASERQAIVDAFVDAKGKSQAMFKRDIKFLIGTTQAMGTGLELTRAHNVVLMEPDEFTKECQAYGRVDRIGQANPVSYSYRLIDGGSEIEKKILQRQVNMKESYGRAEAAGLVGLGIQALGNLL